MRFPCGRSSGRCSLAVGRCCERQGCGECRRRGVAGVPDALECFEAELLAALGEVGQINTQLREQSAALEESLQEVERARISSSFRGSGSRPPSYAAARAGNEPDVRALLAAGADPRAGDDRGRTPLHAAMRPPSLAVVDLLLDAGWESTVRTPRRRAQPHEALSFDAVRHRVNPTGQETPVPPRPQ